jgi:hypothetical protein
MNIENLYLKSTTTIATNEINLPENMDKFYVPLIEMMHAPENPSITYEVIAHKDEYGEIKTIDYVVIQNAKQKTETFIDIPFFLYLAIAIIVFLSFKLIFRNKKNVA